MSGNSSAFFRNLQGLQLLNVSWEAVLETQASSGHGRVWPSNSRATSLNLNHLEQFQQIFRQREGFVDFRKVSDDRIITLTTGERVS